MKRKTTSLNAALVAIAVAALILCGCARRGKTASEEPLTRPFPTISIPTVYSSPAERLSYTLDHYWDEFFKVKGLTDSTHVLGVRKDETETSLATFIKILDMVPLEEAQKAVAKMFGSISAQRQLDDSGTVWLVMTQMVSRYLYDPNSPVRNEDYYLPFVKLLAESPFTAEDMRPAFRYELSGCEICRKGTVAPDFRIRNIRGREFTLHSVKAGYTMLFFSNPGCQACKGIIDEVQSSVKIREMISSGRLAVVNVYIDQDLKAWREYESNYPSSWKTGYDPVFAIRGERLYNVRAIPSLYLLDEEKRIIFKDAPTEKVIEFLEKL